MPFEITDFILGSTSFPVNLHNVKVVVVFALFCFFCCIGLYRVFKSASLWFAYSNRNVVRLSGQHSTVRNVTHAKVVEKVRDSVTHCQITSQCASVVISGHLVSERPKFQGIKSEEASFEPFPHVFTSSSSCPEAPLKVPVTQHQTDNCSEALDPYEIIPGHTFGFEDEKVIQFASRNLHLSMVLECSAAVSMQILCGVPVSALKNLVRNTSLRTTHRPPKATTTLLSHAAQTTEPEKLKAANRYALGEAIELTKPHRFNPVSDVSLCSPVMTLEQKPDASPHIENGVQQSSGDNQNRGQDLPLFGPENLPESPTDITVIKVDPEMTASEAISSAETKNEKKDPTIYVNNTTDTDLLVRKTLFSLANRSLFRGSPMLIRPLPGAEHQEVVFSIPVSMIAHTVDRYNAGEAIYPLVFLLQPMTKSSEEENNSRQAEITVAAFTDLEEAKLTDFTAGKVQVEGQFLLLGKDLLQLLPTYGIWDKNDSLECTVCLTDFKDVIFIPCRHIAVCRYCNKHVTKCPLCRVSVRSFVVFVHANVEGEDIYADRIQ